MTADLREILKQETALQLALNRSSFVGASRNLPLRQFLQPLGETAQPLHPLGVVLVAVIHPGDARNHVPEHRFCHVARAPHCSQQRIHQ